MINSYRVLAIIPARGGSKGVKRKNVRLAGGVPLIARTIREAKQSKYIDRIILSSDNDEIISCAKAEGCDVPFVRPAMLASDTASSVDVVVHAVEQLDDSYEIIVLLQPTSPLRKVTDIDACIEKLMSNGTASVVSVTETDKSPYWMFKYDSGGRFLEPAFEFPLNVSRRQDLPQCLVLNGAIYTIFTGEFMKKRSFILENTASHKMSKRDSIDIDTEDDFKYLQYLLGD